MGLISRPECVRVDQNDVENKQIESCDEASSRIDIMSLINLKNGQGDEEQEENKQPTIDSKKY